MEQRERDTIHDAVSTLKSINSRLYLLMDALCNAKPHMGSEGLRGMYFVLGDTSDNTTAVLDSLRGLLNRDG